MPNAEVNQFVLQTYIWSEDVEYITNLDNKKNIDYHIMLSPLLYIDFMHPIYISLIDINHVEPDKYARTVDNIFLVHN